MKQSFKIIVFLILFAAVSTCIAQDPPSTQKSDMSTARKSHSSCTLEGKIYVIGGKNTSSTFKSMEVYDPVADSWDITKSGMNEERVNFTASVFNGNIFAIAGSRTMSSNPVSEIEVYDPLTNTWTHKTDMPLARIGSTVSQVNGKFYIFGGSAANLFLVGTVDVYDPVADAWTTAENLPTPRINLSSVVLDGKIYVIGGTFGSANGFLGLDIVEAFDPVTNTWETKAGLNTTRKNFTACVLNGMIYVFGGSNLDCDGILSSVEAYDPSTNTWINKTPMPSILGGPSVSVINGKAYIIGGSLAACPASPVASVYEYDPSLDPEPTSIEALGWGLIKVLMQR